MLVSVKINNCLIFNKEAEFSMQANMHYKRFSSNVARVGNINILKAAVLIGPNNSGKSNFIRVLRFLKSVMLNIDEKPAANLFSNDPLVELAVDFLDKGKEYLFEIKYDTSKAEYVYERFAEILRDQYANYKENNILVRDSANKDYYAEDMDLSAAMRVASRNNILIYLVDTGSFAVLQAVKEAITSFASKIDIVDMNNIPIKKTIDMLKRSEEEHKRIANFVLNSDLYLDDYKYLNDDEVKIELRAQNLDDEVPQENALRLAAPLAEMLHLASVYKGVVVPSMLFDSTGTKKMAALASYVIDALENDRILVIDELDNSLHFRLTRAIMAMFNNELNKGAQLIATVHDVSLLDCQTLFRKEQIWFTHKDKDGVYLYSLSEFTAEKDGIRDTTDLISKYRKGVFGALPEPDLFKSLQEVKNNA